MGTSGDDRGRRRFLLLLVTTLLVCSASLNIGLAKKTRNLNFAIRYLKAELGEARGACCQQNCSSLFGLRFRRPVCSDRHSWQRPTNCHLHLYTLVRVVHSQH